MTGLTLLVLLMLVGRMMSKLKQEPRALCSMQTAPRCGRGGGSEVKVGGEPEEEV